VASKAVKESFEHPLSISSLTTKSSIFEGRTRTMQIPFLSQLTNNFTQSIGLDLGSCVTRIWTSSEGIVLCEPTCLAVDERTGKVLAVGSEAQAMAGRLNGVVHLYYPIQNGKLYDFETGKALVRIFLQKVLKNRTLLRPIMMASVPAGATQAERAALVELLYAVGAREVLTIAQPLAAAIGSGVPIADASGSFMFQLGGGVVEAAVISLASLVRFESSNKGGLLADQTIKQLLRTEAQLVISTETAQHLKHEIGSISLHLEKSTLVTGQDAAHAAPKEVKVTAAQLQPAMAELVTHYEKVLKRLFVNMPPELTADVIDKGMLLSGGWAKLAGLEIHLVNTLGIPVSVIDEPDLAVIKGIGTALEHLDLFKQSLAYQASVVE